MKLLSLRARSLLIALSLVAHSPLIQGCDPADAGDYTLGEDFQLDDVIRLEFSSDLEAVPADGATILEVTAMIPENADDTRRTVTLTTTAGAFIAPDGTAKATLDVKADISGAARARLRTPLALPTHATEARITATIQGYVRDTTVVFTRALPEQLRLEASPFSLPVGFDSTTMLSAMLSRDMGRPTLGAAVTFSADIGEIRAVTTSDSNGVAKATYTPGDAAPGQAVWIRAETMGTGNLVLVDSTRVYLRSPG
ncbi:MAG: hypothetical protein AAFN13_06675 [Bacteroidota bacterium]